MTDGPDGRAYFVSFLAGLVLIIILPKVLRSWFPDISFGQILLIVVPIVVVTRFALLWYFHRSKQPGVSENE